MKSILKLSIVVFITYSFFLMMGTAVSANVIVDIDGQASLTSGVDCDGNNTAPSTIEGGLKKTTAGDSVFVCPGFPVEGEPVDTYPINPSNLEIDTPNISLIGTSEVTPTGGAAKSCEVNDVSTILVSANRSVPVLEITADSVAVEGLWFKNGSQGVHFNGSSGSIFRCSRSDSHVENGVQVNSNSSNVTISNSILGNQNFPNMENGLFAENSNSVEILQTKVQYNNISGIVLRNSTNGIIRSNNSFSNNENGISLFEADGNTVANNTVRSNGIDGVGFTSGSDTNLVQNNTITLNSRAGINFKKGSLTDDPSSKNQLINNLINQNGSHGVNLVDRADSTFLSKNKIRQNGFHGIRINNSDSNILSQNLTLSSDSSGIKIKNSDTNLVSGNEIDSNPQNGIWLVNSDSNLLRDNSLAKNKRAILAEGTTSETNISNIATNNDITNNGIGVSNKTSRIFDARNNWWGNPSGPTGGNTDPFTLVPADGTGDSIVSPGNQNDTNVAFDTWASSPINQSPPSIDGVLVFEDESNDTDALFNVNWNVSDEDGNLARVDLTLQDDLNFTEDTVTISSVSGASASGTNELVAAGDEGSGITYTVELTATDQDGVSNSLSLPITESGDTTTSVSSDTSSGSSDSGCLIERTAGHNSPNFYFRSIRDQLSKTAFGRFLVKYYYKL